MTDLADTSHARHSDSSCAAEANIFCAACASASAPRPSPPAMRTSADASSAVERSRGSFNSLAAPTASSTSAVAFFERARHRLGERKGLPGLQRCVLVVGFSQCECRRRSRRGFRAFAQAERHLRADQFHIGELGLESRFWFGSDGMGFVESRPGFLVSP